MISSHNVISAPSFRCTLVAALMREACTFSYDLSEESAITPANFGPFNFLYTTATTGSRLEERPSSTLKTSAPGKRCEASCLSRPKACFQDIEIGKTAPMHTDIAAPLSEDGLKCSWILLLWAIFMVGLFLPAGCWQAALCLHCSPQGSWCRACDVCFGYLPYAVLPYMSK